MYITREQNMENTLRDKRKKRRKWNADGLEEPKKRRQEVKCNREKSKKRRE